MGMNFKDANKTVTRALFVLGADTLERRFVTNPQALRDLFVEVMRIAMPKVTFMPDPDERSTIQASFEGLKTEVTSVQISVHNLFNRLDRSDVSRCRAAITAYAIDMVDRTAQIMATDSRAHLKGPLITLVGPDRMVSDLNRQLAPSSVVSWQISDDLNAIVAVDGKKEVAYLQPADLETLGLSIDQVREKAVANMQKRMQKARIKFEQVKNGILMVTGYEGWTQSLLSLDNFTQALRHRVRDDALVHVFDDLVIAASRSNPSAVMGVLRTADHGQAKSLCPGSYFLVHDEGISTLARDDVLELVAGTDPDKDVGMLGTVTLN